MRSFWTALQFLTRLPVPRDRHTPSYGLVWLPVVGLVLGAVLVVADTGLRAVPVTPMLASALLVILLLALTGGLHADGLMDTCDAVFAHASRERRLEIMHDPHVGAFGVIGLVSVVVLKIAAIDALTGSARAGALLLAPILGRWAIVLLTTLFPYGRPVGLGLSLKLAASPGALVRASALPGIVGLLLWPIGLPLAISAALMAGLLGAWLMRQLPGLTGDCYGAGCEVVETLVLIGAGPLARGLG